MSKHNYSDTFIPFASEQKPGRARRSDALEDAGVTSQGYDPVRQPPIGNITQELREILTECETIRKELSLLAHDLRHRHRLLMAAERG